MHIHCSYKYSSRLQFCGVSMLIYWTEDAQIHFIHVFVLRFKSLKYFQRLAFRQEQQEFCILGIFNLKMTMIPFLGGGGHIHTRHYIMITAKKWKYELCDPVHLPTLQGFIVFLEHFKVIMAWKCFILPGPESKWYSSNLCLCSCIWPWPTTQSALLLLLSILSQWPPGQPTSSSCLLLQRQSARA